MMRAMPPLPTLLTAMLAALEIGPGTGTPASRFAMEDVRCQPGEHGTLEWTVGKLLASDLRLAAGPLTLEFGQCELLDLKATLAFHDGRARLCTAEAAQAQFTRVSLRGPVASTDRAHPAADATAPRPEAGPTLGPLASAEGALRMDITDAHLLFDAHVDIPLRNGRVDFGDASVEHVGPDSRMGVSRTGIYVDAPGGRSYLYQFASPPLEGVEFEERGSLLGWVTRRGALRLQPFAETLLRQSRDGLKLGLSEQVLALLGRTEVSGQLQLGDGDLVVAPGVRAALVGRAMGRNALTLHKTPDQQGLRMQSGALALREAALARGDWRLACGEVDAQLTLDLVARSAHDLRFAMTIAQCEMRGLRLEDSSHAPV